jgi:signal transduction histidine kinase
MRLTVGLVLIVVVMGVSYVGLAIAFANYLVRETGQQLNHTLAANLVRGYSIFESGDLQMDEVRALFRELMVVNPNIEMYLVRTDGHIMAYDAPPEIVRLDSVSLEPVRQFLRRNRPGIVYGDDPRNPGTTKPITVATVREGSVVAGYLYIVIGGQSFDTVFKVLRDSYAVRLAALVGGVGMILCILAAFILFSRITKRVRNLGLAVDSFVTADFRAPLSGTDAEYGANQGDEIALLEQNIERMAGRIAAQFNQLERADVNRRDMIANISHDLRTPIAAIQGYIETVLLDQDAADEKARGHLQSAAANIRRLSALIDQLFELSRLDDPSLKLVREDFSVAELIHDIAQKHAVAADAKNIEIDVAVPDQPLHLTADIGLIERLLDNLIANAIKFVPEHGHISLSAVAGPGEIALRVWDDGPGIDESERERVFQRHFRAMPAGAQNPQGAGLGLSIAKKIVELHGGSIDLERGGPGAHFLVTLPTH